MKKYNKPIPDQSNLLIRNNQTALYEQIIKQLRHEIVRGDFEPSGRLPSEAELGTRFRVSRVTIRLALDCLVNEKLIIRRQGKGSFVAGKQVRQGLDTLRSFHESLLEQGLHASMELIEKSIVTIPEALRPFFGAKITQCLHIKRLHRVDGDSVALGCSYLPAEMAILDWEGANETPIYTLLSSAMGLPVAKAEIVIRAQSADQELARTLNVKSGSALLLMLRTSYFSNGSFSDHATFYIRPERYELTLNCMY